MENCYFCITVTYCIENREKLDIIYLSKIFVLKVVFIKFLLCCAAPEYLRIGETFVNILIPVKEHF